MRPRRGYLRRGLTLMDVAAITGHKTWQMLRQCMHLRAEGFVGEMGASKQMFCKMFPKTRN